MRFPTSTEEDSGIKRDNCAFPEDCADSVQYDRTYSPVTKTDVPDELEIEDIESTDNECHSVTIVPIHLTVNRKRERSPTITMCSLTMRNTRPRLHEEAEITSGAKFYLIQIAPIPPDY